MKNARIKFIAVLLIVFFITACGKVPLYQDLSEEDANGILVLLNENGIKASKKKEERQNEIFWSVYVGNKDMSRARALLVQHNLPRRKELGLTGVYKDKGLIPTPDEQKARYLLALKGEIINSLERIPSVVDADVVLNVPIKDEFASAEERAEQRPTASVIVKLKPAEAGEEHLSEAKFQQFVANAVENLHPRDVTVIISYIPGARPTIRPGEVRTLFPVTPSQRAETKLLSEVDKELVGLRLDTPSKERLKIYLLIFFLVLIILSAGLVISIVQGSRMRRQIMAMQQGEGQKFPAVEGKVMEEGLPKLGEGGPPEEGL